MVLADDSVSFGGDLSGGIISGGSGNDTLNFSAGVNNSAMFLVMLDLISFLLQHHLRLQVHLRRSGADSMTFKGAITNSTIDFGADNDTLTYSLAATSATMMGGAGADTLVFYYWCESGYQFGLRWC